MLQFVEEGMFVLETLYGRALPTIFAEEDLPMVSQDEVAAQESPLKTAHDDWNKPGVIMAKVYRATYPEIRLIRETAEYNSNTHVMCSYVGFTECYNQVECIENVMRQPDHAWQCYVAWQPSEQCEEERKPAQLNTEEHSTRDACIPWRRC